MTFQNPSNAEIDRLLTNARTIAVVGVSDNPRRASCDVAEAMRDFGYRIVPVNPVLTGWHGIPAMSNLDAAMNSLGPGERIDIVNVFRQSQYVADIVDDCLRLGLPALWLQLGVADAAAAARARTGGMTVVMDTCIKVERMRMTPQS